MKPPPDRSVIRPRRLRAVHLLGALCGAGIAALLLADCERERAPRGERLDAAGGGAPAQSGAATASAPVRPAPSSPQPKPVPVPPAGWGEKRVWTGTLAEQNELLFAELAYFHGLGKDKLAELRRIFAESGVIGQGNLAAARHPMSPAECEAKLEQADVRYEDERSERICGSRFMAPLYDPEAQKPEQAAACIDRLEFPNIPCRYPVTWVRANEAVEICRLMGKRLCDAHEWEGACAGRLTPPDYDFGLVEKMSLEDAMHLMRSRHNSRADKEKIWSYGDAYRKGICATGSAKSKSCTTGGWRQCGTNTYPAGSFPECRSALGVYDLHGNAAEHMNLPMRQREMASAGSQEYGYTEMKGSWFVFDQIYAHPDHCRWRAPFWHGGKVMSPASHRNYHLGFRCCKTLGR